MGKKRTGLFKHSRTSRINQDWLRRVPAEASGFATGVWDPYSFAASGAVLLLRSLYGEDGLARQVELLSAQPTPALLSGIDRLAASMGPRYLVYRLPRTHPLTPAVSLPLIHAALPLSDMVVVVELRHPAPPIPGRL